MSLTKDMEKYVVDSHEIAKQFVRDMCGIPAPSHHEERRAAYMKKWFEANGGENVTIDEALNVICPYNVKEGEPVVVFMAHLDTVFPDMEPMPFEEHDGKMFSPGVTDDTANLASLVTAARYVLMNRIPTRYGILFVANSCEEGLGNLKGSRQIVKTYGDRIFNFITVDGTDHTRIVNHGVGSHRYEVVLRTEGGHSYGKFGNRNAIACLANLITALYGVKVPSEGNSKTTYNVGTIEGGTSVNTIAQEAKMLYEYRSDNVNCLAKMENMFRKVVEGYQAMGLDITVERIGERPCGVIEGNPVNDDLIERAKASILSVIGKEAHVGASSTDANIPLSKGIPAICLSGAVGGGCHTRGEWLEVESMKNGVRLLLDFMSGYFA